MHHPKLKDTTEQVKDSQSPYQSRTPTGPGGAGGEPQSRQKHAPAPKHEGVTLWAPQKACKPFRISVSTDPL